MSLTIEGQWACLSWLLLNVTLNVGTALFKTNSKRTRTHIMTKLITAIEGELYTNLKGVHPFSLISSVHQRELQKHDDDFADDDRK